MNHNEKALAGKVAVITGAGRGIGKALALGFAKAGASVVCAARTLPEILAVADEINAADGRAAAVKTDVTIIDSVNELFGQAAAHFGGIDIVVINAGGNYDRNAIEASDPDGWRQTMELNLFGAYYCAQAAIPFLKKRGSGKIITIGSGLGHRGMAGGSAYACSKAGLWMLTRVLAQELWQYNISVNELIPGPVMTSIDDEEKARGNPALVKLSESEWVKMPDDVVPMAIFLACQPDIGPTAQSFSLMRRDT